MNYAPKHPFLRSDPAEAIEKTHPATKSASEGKFIGEIRFFFKTKTLDLGDPGADPPIGPTAPGWEKRHSSGTSGILPSTRFKPAWWDYPDAGEKNGERSVKTVWDCCCKDHFSRMVVTPGFIIK
jgi:hypothetical protein